MSVTRSLCALCGEASAPDDLVVGDKAAICVACVWLCVAILEDKGMHRPIPQDQEEEEQSAVYDRSSTAPASGPAGKDRE